MPYISGTQKVGHQRCVEAVVKQVRTTKKPHKAVTFLVEGDKEFQVWCEETNAKSTTVVESCQEDAKLNEEEKERRGVRTEEEGDGERGDE